MLKRFLATAVTLAGASVAFGEATQTVVGLDGGTGWTATLSGGGTVAGFDVMHTNDPQFSGDGWLTGGIFGASTSNGATFRLVVPDARAADPNLSADWVVPGTDADARLTTFLNLPRAQQNSTKRFDGTDEPSSVPGGFVYGPNAIDNAISFPAPPSVGGNGFWGRVIVNVPNGIDPSSVYVASALANPGDTVLAQGGIVWGSRSTAGADPSRDFPFVIASAIPEPASIALLMLGGLAAIRRR